jgi:hypothetical protein
MVILKDLELQFNGEPQKEKNLENKTVNQGKYKDLKQRHINHKPSSEKPRIYKSILNKEDSIQKLNLKNLNLKDGNVLINFLVMYLPNQCQELNLQGIL